MARSLYMPVVVDKELYQRARAEADRVYSKSSAYKSGFIVKRYKELGGRYVDDDIPKALDRWFREVDDLFVYSR